ncbi:MAG: hypothetical protein U1F98_02570 [Verrucomicrobiota bacterium]
MNPDEFNSLETRISRELRALPELPAPATLQRRVFAALESRQPQPVYRRPWHTWPRLAQAAALLIMIASTAALAFLGWHAAHSEFALSAGRTVSGFATAAGALFTAAETLTRTATTSLRQLNTGFLVACLLMLSFTYAACIGLGTAVVRLARQPASRNTP